MFYIINPHNLKPIKSEGESYFPTEVSSRVPQTLRILGYYLFILTMIGSLMVFEPEELIENNSKYFLTDDNHNKK